LRKDGRSCGTNERAVDLRKGERATGREEKERERDRERVRLQ
jgi:hypothetical protein